MTKEEIRKILEEANNRKEANAYSRRRAVETVLAKKHDDTQNCYVARTCNSDDWIEKGNPGNVPDWIVDELHERKIYTKDVSLKINGAEILFTCDHVLENDTVVLLPDPATQPSGQEITIKNDEDKTISVKFHSTANTISIDDSIENNADESFWVVFEGDGTKRILLKEEVLNLMKG